MSQRPEQTPEGKLIEQALDQHTPPLTQKRAAQIAGMSDARWRQLVSGYQSVGNGYYAPQVARPATLARMARAVGVTPQQLSAVGRPDAAEELDRLTRSGDTSELPVGTGADPLDITGLHADQIEAVKAVIRAMRAERGMESD